MAHRPWAESDSTEHQWAVIKARAQVTSKAKGPLLPSRL